MAIFGLGPVGLCAVAFAAARGARVIGVDLVPERLELARRLGAWKVIDASNSDPAEVTLDLTNGKGISAGADYSGQSEAQEAMMGARENTRAWRSSAWVRHSGWRHSRA
jgi:threonine dehydrogenase-like Zn-dependent dehydrogenase